MGSRCLSGSVRVCHTLNSSLKSLLSSAMRRFISSSSFSTGSGGYFLFVLGRRANSGTVWNSVPTNRKGGGRGQWEGSGETGGERGTGKKGVGKWELRLASSSADSIMSFLEDGHQRAM